MTKTKKTKTKPKARARTAPAKLSAAPEPAPAVVRNVRPRWDPTIPPRDRNPRPTGPLTKTARLVRGQSYTVTWSDSPIYFNNPGPPVAITEVEFTRLVEAVDRIDFADPGKPMRTIRSIRKFVFADAETGKEIEMPAIPDYDVGQSIAMSAGDQAEMDRKFEGQQHTLR